MWQDIKGVENAEGLILQGVSDRSLNVRNFFLLVENGENLYRAYIERLSSV